MKENGDSSKILRNTSLMKLVALDVFSHFEDIDIQQILTAQINGLPVAIPIAHLFDANVTYAKATRDQETENYIEETYKPDASKILQSLYLEKNVFQKNEDILIVDEAAELIKLEDILIYNSVINARGGKAIYSSTPIGSSMSVFKKFHLKLTDEMCIYRKKIIIEKLSKKYRDYTNSEVGTFNICYEKKSVAGPIKRKVNYLL